MKFIILTFFTEGFPYDNGENFVVVEQEFQKIVKDHADKYVVFTPRKLIGIDPEFEKYFKNYTLWLQQHPNRNQLGNYSERWTNIGFLGWKPQFIQHFLNSEEVETGDVVLYHDVDFLRHPNYVLSCEQWRDLSLNILNELGCDIFIPCGLRLKHDVKAYLIRKYLGDHFYDKRGLWGGLIVMKKSRMAVQFLSEWASLSSQLDNISPIPNPDPHPEFVWHSVEQSVASVLAWRWRLGGRLPMDWPRYEVRDRHFSKKNLRKLIN